MRKFFSVVMILFFSVTSFAQAPVQILYGAVSKSSLLVAPYDKWFTQGYDEYQPSPAVINSIKKLDTKNITIEIFFGTWCGDSRREVPRFLKLIDQLGIAEKNCRLIAVGGGDSLIKQSPDHEEAGKGIYRVPTFIIKKNGEEINRINEYPVNSLEKDLYAILNKQSYVPNYQALITIHNWINDGAFLDKNINIRGQATQLHNYLLNERELNALGHLLLLQGKNEEALKVYQLNASLYPESATVLSGLGEAWLKNGDKKNAIQYLERSLEFNKDPLFVKEILRVLYLAKDFK